MLAREVRRLDPLPNDHPCQGCEARSRAVCGVLGCDDLCQLKKLGWTVKVDRGQTLFHEGDPATRVFTLTSGSLKLYTLLADGRRHIAGFMHAGDFLGISVDDRHAFTAEAVEDAQLCWFPRARFDDFVESHGPMERELYFKAAHELAAAQQQLVLLGRKTAIERLASFLLMLAEQAAKLTVEPATVLNVPMSRSDIADYLGLTKETISRVLSTLRGERVIRLRTLDTIEILDRERLEQLSGSTV